MTAAQTHLWPQNLRRRICVLAQTTVVPYYYDDIAIFLISCDGARNLEDCDMIGGVPCWDMSTRQHEEGKYEYFKKSRTTDNNRRVSHRLVVRLCYTESA